MSARNRLILVLVGIALLMLAGFFFLIRPRQSDLAEVRDQVAQERVHTQELQVELQRRQELQDREPQLRAQLAEIRDLVPQDDDIANFVFQVQEAADRSGVAFLQITPQLPDLPLELAAVAEITVDLRGQGGYFSVQDFVRRLYTLDRALRIDVFALTGVTSEEEAARGRTQLQGTLRIFFEQPEGAVVPVPAPGSTTTTTTTPGATPAATDAPAS